MATDESERDLLRTARLIDADITRVYAVLDAIEEWSTWVPAVESSGRKDEYGSFNLSVREGDDLVAHTLRVDGRGPSHTLFLDLDGEYSLRFHARPNGSGTFVEASLHAMREPRWHGRRWRRRMGQLTDALQRLLDDLAAFLAGAPR